MTDPEDDDFQLCDFCGCEMPADDECEPDEEGYCIACGKMIADGD